MFGSRSKLSKSRSKFGKIRFISRSKLGKKYVVSFTPFVLFVPFCTLHAIDILSTLPETFTMLIIFLLEFGMVFFAPYFFSDF